jgi:ABC-type glutathione transport system ATPase component
VSGPDDQASPGLQAGTREPGSGDRTAPLLEVLGLGVRRQDRWTLRGLDFRIRAGEAWGVVGESGAGKSTLTSAVLGLLEATEGSVRLEGEAWSGLPESRRRSRRHRVQAVFQDPSTSLPPHLTGWRILEEPLVIRGRLGAPARREAAARMAARVHFPGKALSQKPAQWSGGLAQRLALGRALMPGPRLLVLDEPLSGLDPTLAGHLLELLLELKGEGLSLLFVSHHLGAVARLCDQLLLLDRGRAVLQGPAEPLFRTLPHPLLEAMWKAVPLLP